MPALSPTLSVQQECALCLSEMNCPDYSPNPQKICRVNHKHRTVQLACGHNFHSDCMKEQLTKGISCCAVCTRPLSQRDISVFNHEMGSQLTFRSKNVLAREIMNEEARQRDPASRENYRLWRSEQMTRANRERIRRRRQYIRPFTPYPMPCRPRRHLARSLPRRVQQRITRQPGRRLPERRATFAHCSQTIQPSVMRQQTTPSPNTVQHHHHLTSNTVVSVRFQNWLPQPVASQKSASQKSASQKSAYPTFWAPVVYNNRLPVFYPTRLSAF